MIDLRSDTLTKPNRQMLEAVVTSSIGDDCFGEDQSVRELEAECAALFGKEAALLFPTGTMSNQVGLRALTTPGDELVCESSYHINFFEASPTVDLAKVSVNAITTKDGILRVKDLEAAFLERARWERQYYRKPHLIWLENTINGHSGLIFPLDELRRVSQWASDWNIPVFMDGARLLNACAATGCEPVEYARHVDMLSICFAKGLGAPMGSVLMGQADKITKARRFRKWYGGAMHQAGIFASAARYAINSNRPQLKHDNENALLFFDQIKLIENLRVWKPQTNIVLMDICDCHVDPDVFVKLMEESGVKLLSWRGTEIRCVFSNMVGRGETLAAASQLRNVLESVSEVV